MTITVMSGTSRLGERVIRALLDRGKSPETIVAAVRNLEKAQPLADLGISLHQAEYASPESLENAFSGTDVLLLIPTFAPVEERIRQHANAVEAALSCGVSRTVFAGFMTASLESKFKVAPFMLYAESKLRVSGLDWTIVRNGRYLEEVSLSVPEMLESGRWEVPVRQGRVAYISRDDLAQAIVEVCLHPDHSQKTYTLTGSHAYSMDELTETVIKITGSQIVYHPISLQDWKQRSLRKGMNKYMVEVIASLYLAVDNGEFEKVTTHFSELVGRPSENPESFLRRSLDAP